MKETEHTLAIALLNDAVGAKKADDALLFTKAYKELQLAVEARERREMASNPTVFMCGDGKISREEAKEPLADAARRHLMAKQIDNLVADRKAHLNAYVDASDKAQEATAASTPQVDFSEHIAKTRDLLAEFRASKKVGAALGTMGKGGKTLVGAEAMDSLVALTDVAFLRGVAQRLIDENKVLPYSACMRRLNGIIDRMNPEQATSIQPLTCADGND